MNSLLLLVAMCWTVMTGTASQTQLTEQDAVEALERAFGGALVAVSDVQPVPLRMADGNSRRRYRVAARLEAFGEPVEFHARILYSRDMWRVFGIEHGQLEMSPDDFLRAVHVDRQRRTMAAMRDLATAFGTMRVDHGRYPENLHEIEELGYLAPVPLLDAWGNAYSYESPDQSSYALISFGADSAPGPSPPNPWVQEPFTADVIIADGRFTQGPTGRPSR